MFSGLFVNNEEVGSYVPEGLYKNDDDDVSKTGLHD